ncbi:MAG: ATP-binding cassette domain-containing protein [Deltaproteobacteria bacterium]|nr:ATP-binding cassette domain-containing protein [Deltaproteobacteria bacterium]
MVEIEVKKRLARFEMDLRLSFGGGIAILTGPNGAGKSTLLSMVAGLARPDEGSIKVNGRVFFDEHTCLPPEQRRAGFVFQENSLFPWLTVERNVLFGLKAARAVGDGRQEKNLGRWLDKLYSGLELTHLLPRAPASLSGGEAQKVALARALAPRPEILLLDEPFSALDASLRPRLRRFLKELRQEWEIPMLMVTHDHAEAYTLGDRIFELVDGRITDEMEKGKVIKMPLVSY